MSERRRGGRGVEEARGLRFLGLGCASRRRGTKEVLTTKQNSAQGKKKGPKV